MPKLSFMKWFPDDWMRDTRLLSAEGKGVWIDILCIAWNEPERGVYTRLKDDVCRELQIPIERYEIIMTELAKVGTVTFRNNLVTVVSRRMVKQEKHYKNNAERQARYRRNANVTRSVTAKTLDSSRLLKTSQDKGGEDLPSFVLRWQTATAGERQAGAAQIAAGLKGFKLSFRLEEEMYSKIMGEDKSNGTVRGKSISQQAAEQRAKERAGDLRKAASPGEIFAGVRDLPKVQPET